MDSTHQKDKKSSCMCTTNKVYLTSYFKFVLDNAPIGANFASLVAASTIPTSESQIYSTLRFSRFYSSAYSPRINLPKLILSNKSR